MSDTDAPGRMALDYHDRTKHHPHRFARSAGTMDWDNQPDPFRTYGGAPTLSLPLDTPDPSLDYASLYRPAATAPDPFTLSSISSLLALSLGLSAWKAVPGQRWSLRINPSSGNLHPTEAHLIDHRGFRPAGRHPPLSSAASRPWKRAPFFHRRPFAP